MQPYRYCILFLCVVGIVGSVAAQIPQRVVFDHALNNSNEFTGTTSHSEFNAIPEKLDVLVAMIAFQEDTEPRTSGNGSFDTTVATRKTIDPSPHDRQYVENHMTFAENYFRKVSNGKLVINTTVLSDVYRVAQQMASYSPTRSSPNNIEIGRLMQDAWRLVDSLTPGIQFQNYNAFMIVHAGVGRDVDLSSSLGFDPTPFDIPSLYVNLSALRKMFGTLYDGIPVDSGSFNITHSIIIPETESREVNTGLGTALLPLGINGLIVASIGSHIGLPDLFDTKTGRTGIGRFGLMDGQSIFSWSGVFPPEPSAWEKYFLGWISPVTVPPGEAVYSLPAVGLSNDPDSVFRVPISAKEYFLVENRNRDANRDGATFTIERDGAIVLRTYFRDTTNFNAFDQDSIYGNVIDVDEFDWSLPGGVNRDNGELFDGGILIWHIDENVIDANYANGAVNADPDRRGVDLEEGDGSQDIGQSYSFIHPGSGSEDGTPLDFWYQGNAATPRVISNEFTPNSNPSSLSNDFANSHVYIKDFSSRGSRMTARIQVGDETVKPLAGFPKYLGSAVGPSAVLPADLDGDGIDEFVISTSGKKDWEDTTYVTDGKILAMQQDGSSFFPTSDSLPIFESDATLSFDPPITVDVGADGKADIVTHRHRTRNKESALGQKFIFAALDTNNDGNGDPLFVSFANNYPPNSILLAPISASDSFICWGGGGFDILKIQPPHGGIYRGGYITGIALYSSPNTFVAISQDSILIGPWESKLPIALSGSPAVANIDGDGTLEVTVLGKNGSVFVLDSEGKLINTFNTHEPISSSPAICDVDGDGRREIVFSAGQKLFAINFSGAPLDYFPIEIPTQSQVISSPVVGDIDGNGKMDILVGTQEGLLCAYDNRGKMLFGFPLQAGGKILASPTIFKTISGNVGIAVGVDDHYLYAWQMDVAYDGSKMPWPMYLHDPQHSGYEGTVLTSHINLTFFPESRAYNWPNPVRASDNFKTHIRYYVASNAKVVIKIFDLAGDLVTELSADGIGGLDNEIEWDVSGIQSGVYFAHIDAQGTGNSGSAVIKIAVVK